MTPDPREQEVEAVAVAIQVAANKRSEEPTDEWYRRLARAALAASRSQEQPEGETLTPEETAEVLAFTGYISAGERDDVVRDLRRARALSSSSEDRDDG